MKKEFSIYIHIPFCERKCNYCAFNSFCASNEVKEQYLDLLVQEIISRRLDGIVKTIYIGGGTPSVLNENQIERVMTAVRENFDVSEDAEITIEANPNSISESLLRKWKELGINRLSIGVQSLDDAVLKKIGRLHSRQQALESAILARKFFDNISCDLIVGLEGENGDKLCQYAKELTSLGIKHVSCYLLEVYDNAPLSKMINAGDYFPLSDEQTIDAFNKLADFLESRGFHRYEISNFAQAGFESRHNLNYWARGEYLGFGISAHSFVDGKRIENAADVENYAQGKQTTEFLTSKEENEEKIMLGLRCSLGVDLSTLKNCDLTQNPYFDDYVKQGILCQKGDLVTLNPKFYHLSNTIISNLL